MRIEAATSACVVTDKELDGQRIAEICELTADQLEEVNGGAKDPGLGTLVSVLVPLAGILADRIVNGTPFWEAMRQR